MSQYNKVTRPILRYHGGKWLQFPWIVSFFPEHRIYVEPYGGGGSILLRKKRCYSEVYNDIDKEIVNVFRVLRDNPEELIQAIELTPFAREEYELFYDKSDDPVEQARRTIGRSFFGFGSASATDKYRTGFRQTANRNGTIPPHDWRRYPEALRVTIQRLRGILIENRDAIEVMKSHDAPNTLYYVDPPYLHDTRHKKKYSSSYRHEMTDEQHEELLTYLRTVEGYVILSGYDNQLYNDILGDWQKVNRGFLVDGGKKRVETLWINPRTPIARQQLLI